MELDQRGQDIVGYIDSIADDNDDWVRYAETEFGFGKEHLDQYSEDFGKDEFASLLSMTLMDTPDIYAQITGDYYKDFGVEIEEFLDVARTKAALAAEQAELAKTKLKLKSQEAKLNKPPPPPPEDTPETVLSLQKFAKEAADPDFATLGNVARLYTVGSLDFPDLFIGDAEHKSLPFHSANEFGVLLGPKNAKTHASRYKRFRRDFFGGDSGDIPHLFKKWQEIGKSHYNTDFGTPPENTGAFAGYIQIEDLGVEDGGGWDKGRFREKWENMAASLGDMAEFVRKHEIKSGTSRPPSPTASVGDEKQGEVLLPLEDGYKWKRGPPDWVLEQMRQLYKTDLFLQFARGPKQRPMDEQTMSFGRDLHYDIMIGLIMGTEKPPDLARYQPTKAKFRNIVSQYTDDFFWGDSSKLSVILEYYFRNGVIDRQNYPQSTVRGWARSSNSRNDDFSKNRAWNKETNKHAWVRAVKRYEQRQGGPEIVTPDNWADLFQKQTDTRPANGRVDRKRGRMGRGDKRGKKLKFSSGTKKPSFARPALAEVSAVFQSTASYATRKKTIRNYTMNSVAWKTASGESLTFGAIMQTITTGPQSISELPPGEKADAETQLNNLVQRLRGFYELVANGTFQKKQWTSWQATNRKLTPKFNTSFIALFNRIPEVIMGWEFRPSVFSEDNFNARMKILLEKVTPRNKRAQENLIDVLRKLQVEASHKKLKLPPSPSTPKKATKQIKIMKKRPRSLSLSKTPPNAPKTKSVKVSQSQGPKKFTLHTPTKKPKSPKYQKSPRLKKKFRSPRPSTGASYKSNTMRNFRAIMGDKNLGSPLKSFKLGSPAKSVASTAYTFNTQAAMYNAPIDRHVLVRLNQLLKPPQPDAPVVDSRAEQEAFGFRMKEWFGENQMRFPIENMVGSKHRFGDWIRLNTHKKSTNFTITRKAHNAHLTALMDFLKGRVPKVFEVFHGKTKIFDIHNIGELEPVVHKLLTRHAKIKIKIAW